MLAEILNRIGDALQTSLSEQGSSNKKVAITIGPSGKKTKSPQLSLQLFRFGNDRHHQNYSGNAPSDRSVYGFTFFIMAQADAYEQCLELTERICDHFDSKPFIQVNTGHREFEVGLSAVEVTLDEINQFWIAQRKPHAPVLFYQARISEI